MVRRYGIIIFAMAILMLSQFSAYLSPVAGERQSEEAGAQEVGPTLATIDNNIIHAEIGTNYQGDGPGIIHLWNEALYPGSSFNSPHDVMWYGQYDYVSIDGAWQPVETGGAVNQISGTQASVTWTHGGSYTLVKDFQTIDGQPAIVVTMTLTNTDTESHTYEIYYADDYCRGGSGGSAKDNLYMWGSTIPIPTCQFIPTTTTRAIIQEMDINPDRDQTGEDWAFLGFCDPGEFYVGWWIDAVYRNWAIGNALPGNDDAPGIRFEVGTLAPGESASIATYMGVTNSHDSIDNLAELIVPCDVEGDEARAPVGGIIVSPNKQIIMAPYIALMGLVGLAIVFMAVKMARRE